MSVLALTANVEKPRSLMTTHSLLAVEEGNCEDSAPSNMLPSTIVIISLLAIIVVVYMLCNTVKIQIGLRLTVGYVLIASAALSIAVTLWIVLASKPLTCNGGIHHLIVTVNNGIYFSCLLCCLIPLSFTIRCKNSPSVLRWLLLSPFIIVQVSLSGAAHFLSDNNTKNSSTVEFCHHNSYEVIYIVSHYFGFIILMLLDLTLLKKFYHNRLKNGILQNRLNICWATLFQGVPCFYVIVLSFLLFANGAKVCRQSDTFFVLLALFPTLLSTLLLSVDTINVILQRRRIDQPVPVSGEYKILD